MPYNVRFCDRFQMMPKWLKFKGEAMDPQRGWGLALDASLLRLHIATTYICKRYE